ncbi:VOC family protein [Halobacillus naozhouensis]|uniref:VOC family protein n=1 Tax=Halobacillus naozhouensis TaxID=554880 RepID=A0ABY8IWH9_9BACI|nr:VOC family protein [Halobacillus naozhouensis]WFT74579.1 VOC family protein [Halobacillus naozhouensis]
MFHHVGIEVFDVKQAERFYVSILGFSVVRRLEWADERIVFLTKAECTIELVQPKDRRPQGVHFAIEVQDLTAKIQEIKNRGLSIYEGPYSVAGLEVVYYQGPNKEIIEFVQRL